MIMMMMIISMTPTLQIIPKERAFKGPHVGNLFSRVFSLAGGGENALGTRLACRVPCLG